MFINEHNLYIAVRLRSLIFYLVRRLNEGYVTLPTFGFETIETYYMFACLHRLSVGQ